MSTLARARANVPKIRTAKDFIVAVAGSDAFTPNVFVKLSSKRTYKYKNKYDKKTGKLIARTTQIKFSGFEALADITIDFFGDIIPFTVDELVDAFHEYIGDAAIHTADTIECDVTFAVDSTGEPTYMSDFTAKGLETEFESNYMALIKTYQDLADEGKLATKKSDEEEEQQVLP